MNEPNTAAGKVSDVSGSTDIRTERMRAQQAVAASEIRYRRLFETAKDGILILDGNTGRIEDANPFLLELTGYSYGDFLGKHVWEIGSLKDIAASKDEFAKLQANDYVRYDDLPLEARDGSRIDVEFVSNVYYVGDRKVIQCNIRDITARKRAEREQKNLEEQLLSSHKMEAIGSLAGGVAHDFNNLLSVILSYTAFAGNFLPSGHPALDDLREVEQAAGRAVVLTRQLLAFSRKQILQPVALNLNQSATRIGDMLRRILGEDIDIERRLAPDLGLTLTDPGQIEQVLMNLIVNARDAMPDGGKLTIETSNVELDAQCAARDMAVEPGPYVLLAVTDTGCGMDGPTRSRIFEPFFTTKEKSRGTGLGLSTAYGIVKQSGGSIRVQSEPGQGTTFKIYLPRLPATAKPEASNHPAALAHTTGTETILVVEDEEALRRVAGRSLTEEGYNVLAASNGEEALRLCAQYPEHIHLLVTDVVMPGMNGRSLAHRLVKTRPTLEVIYMSGYTDNVIGCRGVLDAGMHFLAKPFTASDLARKVREVLDGAISGAALRRAQAVDTDCHGA
jgi:two-component system, cell cycle sensor histidine kinase and response regulator CckA